MKNKKQVINIISGKEYQLHISEINDNLPNDFFYQTYEKALNETKKIIKENNDDKAIIESSNNIISFCGERGQGKSSAMLSFSKILENIESASKYFDTNNSDIAEYKFHILSRIDPTELETNHSILSVIIARIFFDFKKEVENQITKNKIDLHLKNEIINDFQKCYRNINIFKNEHREKDYNSEFQDNIEVLSMISDSANTKNDFHKLVQDFLKLKYNNCKSMLVIQVDDTDLNVRNAYEIVEDIRKYFMMPNVLVLMAANIELLIESIDQNFQRVFCTSIKFNKVSVKKTFEMSNQYISKLMPGNRKINLPKIKSTEYENINGTLNITYKSIDSKGKQEDIYSFKDSKGKDIENLQDYTLRLIYEKTGLIFVKFPDKTHNIIPTNTRDFVNFLSFLHAMPDIKTEKLKENPDINDMFLDYDDSELKNVSLDLIDTRISNLKIFKDYFLETVIKDSLGRDVYKVFYEGLETLDKDIISYTAECYYKYYSHSFFNTRDPRKNGNSNNIKKFNNYKNLYDLFNLQKYISEQSDSSMSNIFFAIETFYSIILNIWYCNHIKEYKILGENSNDRSIVNFIGEVYGKFFTVDNQNGRDGWGHKIKLSTNDYNKDYRIDSSSVKTAKYYLSAFGTEIKKQNTLNNQESFYIYNFDPENLILKSLEAHSFINKFNNLNGLSAESSNTTALPKKFYGFRNLAFIISTNIDLMKNIIMKGVKKTNIRNYSDFLYDAFNTIFENINALKYLSIKNVDVSWVTELIKEEKDWVNKIMEIPYYIEKTKNRLSEITSLLTTVNGRKSTDEIAENAIRVLYIVENIFDLYPMINVQFEIENLKRIQTNAEKAKKNGKNWSSKTCDTYRQEINKLITSAKEKCDYYIKEN